MESSIRRDKLKTRILDAVQDYLADKGYENIRSVRPGMEKPEQFSVHSIEGEFRPDLTGVKDGTRDLFEVELMSKGLNEGVVEKLKAFYTRADEINGRFFLIVPAEKIKEVLELVNENNLVNIGIIQINIRNENPEN